MEGWPTTAAKVSAIVARSHLAGLHYVQVNFHDVDFDVRLDELVGHDVDVVFALSVYRNLDLGHRDRMLAYALRRARRGVVVEGHATVEQDSPDMYLRLLGELGMQLAHADLALCRLGRVCVCFRFSGRGALVFVLRHQAGGERRRNARL